MGVGYGEKQYCFRSTSEKKSGGNPSIAQELTIFERGYLSAAELGFILVAGSEVILPPLELGEIDRCGS
jgi:hypothetical protein